MYVWCVLMWECCSITLYGSHCHGNMHLNNDSKSQRSIPIALCVIQNPVDVRCRQSVREVYVTS